jgi:hypothetical protein
MGELHEKTEKTIIFKVGVRTLISYFLYICL